MCSTGDVTGYRVSMVMRCLIAAKEEQKTRLEEDVEELENALTRSSAHMTSEISSPSDNFSNHFPKTCIEASCGGQKGVGVTD